MKIKYEQPLEQTELNYLDYPDRTLAYSTVYQSVMLNCKDNQAPGWVAFDPSQHGAALGPTRTIHGHILATGATVTLIQTNIVRNPYEKDKCKTS